MNLSHELAACTRMLAMSGLLNYSGHLSARCPGGDTMLIQRRHDVRAEVEPRRLLECDLSGSVVSGDGKPPSEVFIHTEIYRARPDVQAIAHLHYDPATVLTVVEGMEFLPLKNHASRWGRRLPVHPDSSHIATPEQGRQLAETLGSASGAMLRAHGQVLVCEDVPAMLTDATHFAENVDVLLRAWPLGRVMPLTDAEMDMFLATFDRKKHCGKVWNYLAGEAARAGILPPGWLTDEPAVQAAQVGMS